MVSKITQDLITWDRDHILHPYTPVGQEMKLVFEKGQGIWLQDTEGKQYIDMAAQLGYALLGHGHREIADAISNQVSNIAANHIWFTSSNTKTIEAAQKLAEVTPPGLDHFHFTSGGSEANDSALKLARLYWHLQGKNKWKVICFYGAYHGFGSLTWATSLGKGVTWKGFGAPTPGFVFVPSYYCYRCMFGMRYPECNMQCAQYMRNVIESEGADQVAAVMGEPVMGAAGQIPAPPEYWPMVRKICEEYDVLLIADEVQSGFTKTGSMFGVQSYGIIPDIMTMAKAITNGSIPYAAVAINDKIYETLKANTFWHGFTYSGHPTGAAASLATLNVFTRDNVADNAARVGKHIMERLESEFRPLPCVGGIHGRGLMIGMNIVADKNTGAPLPGHVKQSIQQQLWNKGLYARPIAGYDGTILFICPPCIITVDEADEMLNRLLEVLRTVEAG